MGMQVGDKTGGPMGDINVTPLVDVVLVLLIIFLVVTPMMGSGVEVTLPSAESTDEVQDVGQHLIVSIRSDAAVFVETNASSHERLLVDLNHAYSQDGERSLLIKGDKTLKWREVKEVMDIINDGGMHTMLLATEKPKEEG